MNEQQEREAFEAWMRSVPGHQSLAKEYMNEDGGRYDSPFTNLMWEAWQARAALGVAPTLTPEEFAHEGAILEAEVQAIIDGEAEYASWFRQTPAGVSGPDGQTKP